MIGILPFVVLSKRSTACSFLTVFGCAPIYKRFIALESFGRMTQNQTKNKHGRVLWFLMTLHQQSSGAKCEERNTFVVSWLTAPNQGKKGFFIVIGDIDCDHIHFIRAWKISPMWSLTTILITVSLIPQPGVTGIGTSNKVGFGENY